MSGNSSPSHSTDTSLSLSPGLLPDKNTEPERVGKENDGHSSISEHISSLNSLENDRSLVEIEISNIPDLNTQHQQDLLHTSPPLSLSSTTTNSATKNVKSVLEEILHNEQFASERSDRLDSNEDVSLNIFDGVNLDDNSINNYVLKLKRQDASDVFNYQDDSKFRSLEDALSAKDSIIQALNADIESLKDMASNPSTMSLSTTLTEYKQLQEECETKLVSYENALVHRDAIIKKLKESLIGVQKHEDDMRTECEQYSKDIQCLQKELAEAVEYIKKCKLCKCLDKTNNVTTNYNENDLNAMYTKLEGHLGPENSDFLLEIKQDIRDYVETKLQTYQSVHQVELGKLQDKHFKEMDDSRKFYEKKCADILSDELVSHHSRKLSDELSDDELHSEDEMPEIYGAGGDNAQKSPMKSNWTLEAVHVLKKQVDRATVVLDKYDLENVGEDALASLKTELGSLRLSSLTMQDLQRHYNEQIDVLKKECQEMHDKDTNDATTQANSGEYELDGIVKSYQVQLAEQVQLAKFDVISALEENISILAASNCDDDDWPKEFLEIRNKLSANYIRQIATLQEQHVDEIARLKQDHLKALNNAATRAARRSLDFTDNSDVLKERKTTNTMRNLLLESYKYFAQCEEELNTTLFEELAKQSHMDSDSDHYPNVDPADTSTSSSSKTNDTSSTKRVHLAPNINEFIEKIDNSNLNVSLDFKHELGTCLDRLRTEANAILALTIRNAPEALVTGAQSLIASGDQKSLEDRVQSLTQQIRTDSQIKEELNNQLTEAKQFVKCLEMERRNLEKQLEDVIVKNRVTESELAKARDKVGELIEYGRKEIVSEGYGESTLLHGGGASRASLSDLHERARQLLADHKGDANTLQIIEQLCRECNQLVDESKRDRQDFLLQIDSADKKLKATQRFLEEQAAEREQERDEAQKMISALKEQLKDRDKDRAGFERVNKEVEGFELQMRDMSKLIEDRDKRYHEVNAERGEAIEKISLLRDIIKDLEQQVGVKAKVEEELKLLVNKQRETNDELLAQLDTANNSSNFQTHILQLEEEVSKLRRASDIVGNEGLIKQIQLQLHDLELCVDKNIREMESLYVSKSTTTCSTPSEEMSVQDQIRPKTPNSTSDDCEVPLLQLARLKEKLLKHSRAENSAIKRIQDMELQLVHAKQEHDELQNERDVLQEQVSEQLVLISSLQMRLDDQRIRAEHVQKQANASLEMRIYDLENDLQTLRDKLQSRESTIKQLNKVIDETKQRLKDREDELSLTMEESEVCELKREIDKLKADNDLLRLKIESDAQNAKILPSLVDNIIADKNKDIEGLRMKLEETERQFDLYRSINSTDKTDDATLGALSFFNISTPEQMRSAPMNTTPSLNVTNFVPEISSIEKIGPPNVHYTTDAPLMKPNSTELHKSTEKRVHFEDDSMRRAQDFDALSEECLMIKEKLREEENITRELRVDLAEVKMHLTEREKELNVLQEDAKRKDDMYIKLAKEKRDIEKQFDTLETIRNSIEDLQRNEEQLKRLLDDTKGKFADKQASYDKLQKEYENYKQLKEEELTVKLQENQVHIEKVTREFEELRQQMQQIRVSHNDEVAKLKHLLEDRECELEIVNEDVTRYQNDIATLEERIKVKPSEQMQGVMHKKEVAEKDLQIVKLKATIDNLKREIIHIQDFLNEKDKIIDTMKLDSETLRINLETIKTKMNEAGNIYDLQEKLVRERELNAQLQAETVVSIDDIGDQVRKQLDDSAHLDDKIIHALSSGDFNSFTDTELLRSALRAERKSKLLLENHIRDVESKLNESADTIKRLQIALDDQRKLCNEIQVEDTNLMDQMRAKLEEALENEIEYEVVLKKEQMIRAQLENEITCLRKKDSNSLSGSSKTEYRSLAQDQRLQNEIKQLQDELVNVRREVSNQKKAKSTAESGLKYTKEILTIKVQEVETLEARIANSDDELRQLKEKMLENKIELDAKHRAVEHSRVFIDELEQEKLQLSMKLNLLEAKTQDQIGMTSAIPDVFLQKMKDLAELVTEHINENKLMTDTIVKLTDERNQLQVKLRHFEEADHLNAPFDDPVARANHLFGKYLRADSYRHALAYQKKYLIGLLATYQDVIAHPLSKFQPKMRHAKNKGVNRFRSVVVVCIAIFRMKYMVQRWHSGSRSGAYLSLQRKFRSSNLGTHFQVGQPVSSEHFRVGSNRQPLMRAGSGIPWSGLSPPSKETATQQHPKPSPSQPVENLRPPAVELDTYIERFNLIQQRLGMALNSFNS